MENTFYVLRFGGDFVIEDNSYLFTKTEIAKLYNKTLNNLLSVIEDGNEKDRKYAMDLAASLFVQPMRLH
jgi:hypothetical protein